MAKLLKEKKVTIEELAPPFQIPFPDEDSSVPRWKSFGWGVFACLAAALSVGALFALVRGWQRLRHKRELRRMASLDS